MNVHGVAIQTSEVEGGWFVYAAHETSGRRVSAVFGGKSEAEAVAAAVREVADKIERTGLGEPF